MSDYRLPTIPLNDEQEHWVKSQAKVEERSIAAIIRRMIDKNRKAKKAAR